MRTVRLYDAAIIAAVVLGLIFYASAQSNVKKRTEEMNEIMSSWVGASEGQLYRLWGPPTEVFDDGHGGKIVVYREGRSVSSPGSITTHTTFDGTYSHTTYTPPKITEWSVWRAFWVNSQGQIYHWAWKGF